MTTTEASLDIASAVDFATATTATEPDRITSRVPKGIAAKQAVFCEPQTGYSGL